MGSWDLIQVSLSSKDQIENIQQTSITFFSFAAEQNDSQHVIQNIKKICTDSSSDEMNARRQLVTRTTDVLDPAFKLPFKYGWKRELVRQIFLIIKLL